MPGVFKWGNQPNESSAAPVPAGAADVTAATKVLPRFLAAIQQRSAPVLLDLGPVVGQNVEFFGERLACKIFVEDLIAEIESAARQQARDSLATRLPARLLHQPESVDGILCWDIFDYLDKPAGAALAKRLTAVLRPGGVIYGLFATTPLELKHYTRFIVEAADSVRQRPYPATPVQRQVLLARDIQKMFEGLTVVETVLLKSSTREVLLRRG